MNNYKTEILKKICYTELVYERINKKLNKQLSKSEIEELILKIIKERKLRFLLSLQNFPRRNHAGRRCLDQPAADPGPVPRREDIADFGLHVWG